MPLRGAEGRIGGERRRRRDRKRSSGLWALAGRIAIAAFFPFCKPGRAGFSSSTQDYSNSNSNNSNSNSNSNSNLKNSNTNSNSNRHLNSKFKSGSCHLLPVS